MSSKKSTRQRRKKKQSNVSKIISSGQSANNTLLDYFEKQTPQEIFNNYKKIKNHPYFVGYTKLQKNKSISELYNSPPIFTALEKSIYWSIAIVKNYRSEIQFALDKESELTTLILEGNFDDCYKVLDTIAKNSGRSFWEIQLRGAIEQKTELSETSEFSINNTLDLLKKNKFVTQLIQKSAGHYDDPETFYISSQTYKHELWRSAHPILKSFLTYKLFSYDPNFEYDFEKIFNIERQSSPIDIFFLLVRFLAHQVIGANDDSPTQSPTSNAITLLSDQVKHPILENLEGAFNKQRSWSVDKDLTNLLNKTEAQDQNGIALELQGIKTCNVDVQVLEQLVRANIDLSKSEKYSIKNTVEVIRKILEKNEDQYKHLESLAFDAYRYRSLTWFVSAALFTERESDFTSNENRSDIEKLITIHSPTTKADNLNILNPSDKNTLIDKLLSCSENTESLYHKIFLYSNLQCGIPKITPSIFEARLAIKNGNLDAATGLLSDLSRSKDRIIKNEAIRLLTYTLTLAGKHEQAVETIVDSVLNQTVPIGIFDTNSLLELILDKAKESRKIVYPILYSLHSRFCDSNFDPELKYLFENFLVKNGKQTPEDLFFCEDEFKNSRLSYFFKWVCTPENMKLYLEFDTQKDIQNCRLAICSYLMEKGDSSTTIQSEVKEINKTNAIKKAAEKVDNSRIYVNTDVFVGRNSSVYRDLFQHYENLTKNDYSSHEDEQSFDSVYNIFSRSKDIDKNVRIGDILSTLYFPYIKLNTKNATFLSLFKLIREEFTFGEKGLNNHLSTRIRHGVLPTALRKPIVDESLYLSETLTESEFIESTRWIDPIYEKDYVDAASLYSELKFFTKKLERLIGEINDEWLQINTLDLDSPSIEGETDNPNCLFKYPISPIESYALQKELPISPSYNDFIQVALRWLWEKTESNLELVQKQLNSKALDSYCNFLDELKDCVRASELPDHQVSEICNACDRAKQKLRTQIEIICSWFTHIEGDSYEEYDLETAVDIAKKSLNVDVSFTNNASCNLKGRALSYTVDIFFILFENAISKSNLDKGNVGIEVFSSISDDKNFVLKVVNSCQPSKDVESIEEELEFYRNAYGDEELIQDVIQQEGGTGFFKIWKILEKDLETSHDFNINFLENKKFEAEIVLHKSKSITWDENINC